MMTVLVSTTARVSRTLKPSTTASSLGYRGHVFPVLPLRAFIALTSRVWTLLVFFLASRTGRKTDIYYIDSTPLPVCHKRRIAKHKVFTGLAAKEEKTSMGWFFGFKLLSCPTISARSSRSNYTRQCSRHNARARIDQGPERQALWRQGVYRPKTRARASAPQGSFT